VLRIGKPEGDNLYAALTVTGGPKHALEGCVVLIPKSKLDDILKKRADMLAPREEKKKK
jgi:hypothetical protein